jgi:carbamoyltransferase
LIILGISCYFHDASAALIDDGVLIAAVEEERFTRKKHDFEFPHNAIQFCLDQANIEGKDLDYVVFFEKPFVKFDRLLKTTLSSFPKTYMMFVQAMRTWLFDKLWVKSLIGRTLGIDKNRILFCEHHLSHAASAYFCSPFEESAVLTFDGVGEWATTTIGYGRDQDLNLTRELHFPHSIGLLYSVFTAFLGFEVNEGEYKVMGMAPYGTPRYVDKVRQLIHQNDDGAFWMDPSYFSIHYHTKRAYTRKFTSLFGEPRDPNVPFFTETSAYPSYFGDLPRNFKEMAGYNQRYADIAASIQAVTEELILDLVRQVHQETGSTRLCLAGGVALNSVVNGRILRETPFEELYIQPSAGDGGGALGAALFAWHCALGNSNRFVMHHAYWGPSYETEDIQSALDSAGLTGQQLESNLAAADVAAERLSEGQVIGWFQGRAEWGPRALGNRSILADPRRAETKDLVNTKIKFREPFRPFAPSVLVDSAKDYFDLPKPESHLAARFMLLVVPVLEHQQEVIPAVSHMGTARIQTVHEEFNPAYHRLISRFGDATGVPVVLNTSFNVQGEPVVNSPIDALNTFLNSGIDTLVMDNFIVERRSS